MEGSKNLWFWVYLCDFRSLQIHNVAMASPKPYKKTDVFRQAGCNCDAPPCVLSKILRRSGNKPCRVGISGENVENRVFRQAYRLYARFSSVDVRQLVDLLSAQG